mmetsp:Transcript_22691/g.56230  ORF Transcript_22691/g.56230 Transcript_22691/m.56230 type:complete len:264 (+) Transcript_22691:526-1317(+)
MPPARRRNAWWPCMMPSKTNTSPLSGVCTAPMSTGNLAISCTPSRGVMNFNTGSEHACNEPSRTPSNRPHTISRSANFFASNKPPSLVTAFIRWGMRMAASVDSARMAMTPSWNICADTVCAAAAVPVGSIVRIDRMTAMNVMFCAMERSCTAAPPTIRLPICLKEGTRNIDLTVMIFLSSIAETYSAALVTSEAEVAMAAPATPIALILPTPKMSSGSSTTLTSCANIVIFIGVVTSSVPRNAAKPTVEMMAGTKVRARHPI